MQQILIVDNNPTNTKLLKFLLQEEGYEITATNAARKALEHLDQDWPDLILLDTDLPDITGLELCRLIRQCSDTPIMMLSAQAQAKDKVIGLRAGADDYLGKPYDPDELVARVWALLRRSAQLANSESNLKNADLHLDPSNNRVTLTRTGATLALTPIETRLLCFLMSNPGRTLTREALVIKVWGYEYDRTSNQLDVYVSHLRNKLEENPREPRLIQTIRGIGYRLQPSSASPAGRKKLSPVAAD